MQISIEGTNIEVVKPILDCKLVQFRTFVRITSFKEPEKYETLQGENGIGHPY